MKKKYLLIILITALVLSGCKSLFTREGNLLSDAKQAEKRGEYHSAVINVVESIKIDNEYDQAIEFLIDIYPKSINFYTLKIEETISAGGAFSNDKIVKYYEYLKDINDAARSLPPVINPKTKMQLSFTFTDHSAALEAARELAAEDHYMEGIRFMNMDGRENAKSAVYQFETALSYVAGYKDAEQKAQEALEAGTQVLAFFPFINNAWNIPIAQFSDIVQNKIISSLVNDPEVMKFTKIVDSSLQDQIIQQQLGSLSAMMDDSSRVEIGQLLNSNIIITGTINSARIEGPSTTMNQFDRTAEIAVEDAEQQTESYYKNDRTNNLQTDTDNAYDKDETSSNNINEAFTGTADYSTVEVAAKVFYYRKTISFDVNLSYLAVDVETGSILKSDTITITAQDFCEWAQWSGNEEALTDNDKLLIDTYEQSVMSAQQIATKTAEDAGTKIAEGLASFLK